jgi:DNA-binding LytR/AlgR family response regulator
VILKKINGLKAAEKLRQIDRSVLIVFYTRSEEHIWQCFDVEPLYYMRKPITYEKVHTIMEKATSKISEDKQEVFTFSFNNATFRIPLKEIVYFESKLRVITIRTVNDRHRFYGKLDDVAKNLQNGSFVRCHQSYIVNMQHIQQINKNNYLTTTKEMVVISRKKSQEVKNRLYDHSGNAL